MKFILSFIVSVVLSTLILTGCGSEPITKNVTPEKYNPSLTQIINEFKIDFTYRKLKFNIPHGSKVDSIETDTLKKTIKIDLNDNFSYQPFRTENVNAIYSEVKNIFGSKFSDYSYSILSLKRPIEELIPNYYRADTSKYDNTRLPVNMNARPTPVVKNMSKEYVPSNGLFGKNMVVWPSHGWYYDSKEGRWEWQRPRLFQSVEDVLPLSFVVPYLMPMLENAGAIVFDPRERDIQKYSVVVDNDSPSDIKLKHYIEKSPDKKNRWKEGGVGFSAGNPPYPSGYNPFVKGTSRIIIADSTGLASVSWVPDIPAEGEYVVYVAYSASMDNAPDVEYTVFHSGIKTVYKVNQQVGGSTWIYLGEFRFDKGYNTEKDKVVLSNKSGEPGKIISADAVRFGGGEGIIERGGTTSGRPKVFEAARYYLQYAGMPDTLVYDLDHDSSDYADDYKSRGEYVNYLYGKPFGPNVDRDVKGLSIPVDLSLAFHTDAGISHNDTTVGTLAIYSIPDAKMKDVFPDGTSRFANRDLADIIQTQIVNDIRAKYDSTWARRQLKSSDYSEVVRPNVPSVIIELLSHQNFNDMKFALD
ncbi:MAG: N-acetylmuramoyl-L-alanine amidase, partial [Ignavibacteriaceae bacterium]|nr:N-acetylmuramoyl-L-alanine amidase [Ignavibacteriaceae bacterium]